MSFKIKLFQTRMCNVIMGWLLQDVYTYFKQIIKNFFVFFPSRWQRRQTRLASSHNHNKITSKIWNHHCSEWTEIKLNGSLATTELKKPHPPRLVGEAQVRKGLVHAR